MQQTTEVHARTTKCTQTKQASFDHCGVVYVCTIANVQHVYVRSFSDHTHTHFQQKHSRGRGCRVAAHKPERRGVCSIGNPGESHKAQKVL